MLFKVSKEKIAYSKEPENSIKYTEKLDKEYSAYAKVYDLGVKLLPVWKSWIENLYAGKNRTTWRNLQPILVILNHRLEPNGPLVEVRRQQNRARRKHDF
jgi:hypothetical protein